jgi:hypothetical protein
MASSKDWWQDKEAKRSKKTLANRAEKNRRKSNQQGTFIWVSCRLVQGELLNKGLEEEKYDKDTWYKQAVQGTYVKEIHGPIGTNPKK